MEKPMLKLFDLLTEGVYDKGIFKAVFMAGGPGSGKSYVVRQLFGIPDKINISVTGMKSVNSDTQFEKLLKDHGFDPAELDEYPDELFSHLTGANKKGGAPTDVDSGLRKLAKNFTQAKQDGYMKGKLGMVIDGTGHNFSKIKQQKIKLEKEGYDTHMVFVNTSLDVAQARNKARKRVLPPDLVKDSWEDVQKNIGGFQSIFGSNFVIVDNSDTLTSKAAEKKFGKYVKSHISRWSKEPIRNPKGQQWVRDQLKLKNAGIK
jgi:predicted kinase